MLVNIAGNNNVAIGSAALDATTGGSQNVAIGTAALGATVTANGNTAVGFSALAINTTGANNTAIGEGTGSGNFSGSVILGKDAAASANNQFVVGSSTTNAGTVDTVAVTPTKRWKVKINGVDYYIALQLA